jgi:hypothetical protein
MTSSVTGSSAVNARERKNAMTEQLKLDWETAEVSDGSLTVGLSDKPPKQWRNAFETTATLLNNGSWTVSLDAQKRSVQVTPVEQGDEERVREFVEGAVLQANSTLVSEPELFGLERTDDDEDEEDATSESEASGSSRDEELTQRFRAFAGEHASAEENGEG